MLGLGLGASRSEARGTGSGSADSEPVAPRCDRLFLSPLLLRAAPASSVASPFGSRHRHLSPLASPLPCSAAFERIFRRRGDGGDVDFLELKHVLMVAEGGFLEIIMILK